MADVEWLIRRLKAMSAPEVMWRVSQKMNQKKEEKRFKPFKTAVTDAVFNEKLSALQPDADKMHINFDNRQFSLNNAIPLLGGYDYESYKKQWNAGFQTENKWPEQFSYDLEYKQRDDIGDARTNWELNRHFQFALLAKNYAASRDLKYLAEFTELFDDWNAKNPFLWGISWTSVMEIAIRCSNWCYAYCFLSACDVPEQLMNRLRIGIINMTEYVVNHYSRYSSANNHLIVEVYAIGQSGILFKHEPWVKLAAMILTREFPLQNYEDGVNKELSLHYQSFYMEAVGLMMRLMVKNNIKVPESWYRWLTQMSGYLADCIGDYGEMIEFGDNDEGKILDLSGAKFNHYKYVLGLMSLLLSNRYTDEYCENLRWLFEKEETEEAEKKKKYKPGNFCCYKTGGNTIMRSDDRKVLIGIDHAALGFGSIAAHGHADALSFQMFVEGVPVFMDPGTYIYHCDIESRNCFRKTKNHNTVCVGDKDQSEMLGAFLWGKRAECTLINGANGTLEAEHNGYGQPVGRRYEFKGNELVITDTVPERGTATLVLNPDAEVIADGKKALINVSGKKIEVQAESEIRKEPVPVSVEYGKKQESIALRYEVKGTAVTRIGIR